MTVQRLFNTQSLVYRLTTCNVLLASLKSAVALVITSVTSPVTLATSLRTLWISVTMSSAMRLALLRGVSGTEAHGDIIVTVFAVPACVILRVLGTTSKAH